MEGMQPIYHHKKSIFSSLKFWTFMIFMVVVIFVIYSASSGGGSGITGNVIGVIPFIGSDNEELVDDFGDSILASSKLSIDAGLRGIPNLKINEDFKKIEIVGSTSGIFYAGDQKYGLSSSSNFISLVNYSGDFILTSDGASLDLKGKVDEVYVNGIQIEERSGGKIKVSTGEPLFFDSIGVSQVSRIKEINFVTSGEIIFDSDNELNINNEDLTLRNFEGDFNIENLKTSFNGIFSSLIVEGDRRIIIG